MAFATEDEWDADFSLLGFGLDSFVEVLSAVLVLLRLASQAQHNGVLQRRPGTSISSDGSVYELALLSPVVCQPLLTRFPIVVTVVAAVY